MLDKFLNRQSAYHKWAGEEEWGHAERSLKNYLVSLGLPPDALTFEAVKSDDGERMAARVTMRLKDGSTEVYVEHYSEAHEAVKKGEQRFDRLRDAYKAGKVSRFKYNREGKRLWKQTDKEISKAFLMGSKRMDRHINVFWGWLLKEYGKLT